MNDDHKALKDNNKALKKVAFYEWVEKHWDPLVKEVASIKGTLKVLIPLVIATFIAIVSLAVIVANGD